MDASKAITLPRKGLIDAIEVCRTGDSLVCSVACVRDGLEVALGRASKIVWSTSPKSSVSSFFVICDMTRVLSYLKSLDCNSVRVFVDKLENHVLVVTDYPPTHFETFDVLNDCPAEIKKEVKNGK